VPSSPDDDRALLDRLGKAAVQIETVSGRPLEDLASYDWRDTTRPDAAAARVRAEGATVDPQILDEVHHRQYGRPWALGKYLFDFLVERGLRPGDRLLDIGCGALRLGLPAIAYLDRGTYFGVDAHLKSLEAAVTYELPLHGLEHQRPRLLWDDAFAFANFDVVQLPVNVKVGQHTVYWGESLLLGGAIHGISYSQNSIDAWKKRCDWKPWARWRGASPTNLTTS